MVGTPARDTHRLVSSVTLPDCKRRAPIFQSFDVSVCLLWDTKESQNSPRKAGGSVLLRTASAHVHADCEIPVSLDHGGTRETRRNEAREGAEISPRRHLAGALLGWYWSAAQPSCGRCRVPRGCGKVCANKDDSSSSTNGAPSPDVFHKWE